VNLINVKSQDFYCQDIISFRKKALQWADIHYDTYMLLNGNGYDSLYGSFPDMLAIGRKNEVKANQYCFDELESFVNKPHNGLFGFLTYDLKNEIEKLTSLNEDVVKFPALHFFEPQVVIRFDKSGLFNINAESPVDIYNLIIEFEAPVSKAKFNLNQLIQHTSQEEYIEDVRNIINHIEDGDIYELNYCISFSSKEADIDVLNLYLKLNELAPTPFSTLYKSGIHSIISASPERFLKKTGHTILSQPMKGTIGRGTSKTEDIELANKLRNSEKEVAENMMIVDLVRNDLAKSCKAGTVRVDDLFGVYQFPTVHQMISTISGKLKEEISLVEIIKNAYPMGSMTGAPKIRAMELIDQFEKFKRGPFSGAAGYIAANGDFDLNVLIRSVFYNKEEKHLTFAVGSAITYDSAVEQEYNECLLKAEFMLKLLSQKL